jgi:uncharacterized protein
MRERSAFGYVVAVDGSLVTLNLNDFHRGQMAAHRGGVSSVTDMAAVFGVNAGDRLMVLRVNGVAFVEPREAHRVGVGTTPTTVEPLRNMTASVIGSVRKRNGACEFVADSLSTPPLGAEAFPLSQDELRSLLQTGTDEESPLQLGLTVRGGGGLRVGVQSLLPRHVAVLGSTGQGKSCFTAAILQQLLALPKPRLVVFDVNGEYADALRPHAPGDAFKHTVIGTDLKIPFYALGRHGLSRLLLPSEKTQRPALNFALEKLDCVRTYDDKPGAGLVGSAAPIFFDDCRPGGADAAHTAIGKLREGSAQKASTWPHMRALSCLVAEGQTVRIGLKGVERNSFEYGNIAPLVTRINRCIEDPQFCQIVDITGGSPCEGVELNWRIESADLVRRVFGASEDKWKIHVVDLRRVAHDLMPLVLGSLLELFAFELFERGPGTTYPTLLVLEEAHHYLRRAGDDESGRTGLAYERLAKEGRKFGVALWLSTQRPAEVSHTVLAQCGTWVVFKLSVEQDLKAVANAAEWADRQEVSRIAGLPRQQALVFGSAVVVPTRIVAPTADPVPKSIDPVFKRWTETPTVAELELSTQSSIEVDADSSVDEIPF